jgi:glucokinase
VGWALGILLADLVNIFNLPMIVIGGGVAAGWEAFAPTMMHELQQRSFVYAATEPEPNLPAKKATLITRALLGSDAGLYGAAKLALDKK